MLDKAEPRNAGKGVAGRLGRAIDGGRESAPARVDLGRGGDERLATPGTVVSSVDVSEERRRSGVRVVRREMMASSTEVRSGTA